MPKIIWIDIINPSHTLFFNSLINEMKDEYDIKITLRERAETVKLAKQFGLHGEIIGKDYEYPIRKVLSITTRTFLLASKLKKFDYALSFENGMSVAVSRLRKKKSILFCDNDLKFLQKKSFYQDFETKIKSMAEYIIVPLACYDIFKNHMNEEKPIAYNGYKEDIYIADYKPDPNFKDKVPYENFIVVRPEALGSFYVKEDRSIVPELLGMLKKENINVVYLPREKKDFEYAKGFDIYIPKKPLNGLDLCYYANAILTGSGTMAREAACMGKPAVSFFPSEILLSVDKKLAGEGKMFHSRNTEEIVNYVISHYNKNNKKQKLKLDRCKNVKKEVIQKTQDVLNEEK